MLSDKDKAMQRAFERHMRDLQNLIDDIGGTKHGAKDKGSAELKHAWNKFVEGGHWMREHFFRNVIEPEREAERKATTAPGGGGMGGNPPKPFRREEKTSRPMTTRPRAAAE